MTIPIVSKPYLSSDEAVAYLSLPTRNALKQRMKRGTIPVWCYTRLGGSLRFIRSALDDLLQVRERQAALHEVRKDAVAIRRRA
jgi:hypothetical protein